MQVPAARCSWQRVLSFWFAGTSEEKGARWFGGSPELDATIKTDFGETFDLAVRGDLQSWMDSERSCLALIITLDQFSLHIHRNEGKGYELNALSVPVCLHALDRKYDSLYTDEEKNFCYLPLMHAEDMALQNKCVELVTAAGEGMAHVLPWAVEHRDIVAAHGRFPGRNECLGRTSTEKELEYLKNGGVF